MIGKDSFGMRYHVRLPGGESFNTIRFPPPDDYMPLIKETGGAIFTLKAFVSNHSKWSKALPISISKALGMQIEQDQTRCKICKCDVCKNVRRERCDFGK